MRDVSRAEYDAALKRVRAQGHCGRRDCPYCAMLTTLAALGLDEPPTTDQRKQYLVAFLRGCAEAADRGELGVDQGRLLVNGDLMREAASALDEPPTEPKPFDVRDHPMAFPSHVDEPPTCSCTVDADDPDAATEQCPKSERDCGHHCAHSWSHDRCCWCGMEWGESGVVPPVEPPKACPTCKASLAWAVQEACPDCGSGIDGGTA